MVPGLLLLHQEIRLDFKAMTNPNLSTEISIVDLKMQVGVLTEEILTKETIISESPDEGSKVNLRKDIRYKLNEIKELEEQIKKVNSLKV